MTSAASPHRFTSRATPAAVAVVLFVLAGIAAGRTHHGTFGVTAIPVDCGSVWQLPWRDKSLNAATCTADLRNHVTLTAVLLGAAIGAAGAAPWRRHLRWLLPLAGIVAGSFIALGRHFIWSMTGA